MARGKGNSRGRNSNSPGRGGGRGFGSPNANGRGGRGAGRGLGRGGGRGRGRGGGNPYEDLLDFSVNWIDPYTPPSADFSPRGRGRGRGRGGSFTSSRGFPGQGNVLGGGLPRGNYTPRGRGRGLDADDSQGRAHEVAFVKRLGAKLGAGAPLRNILYEDRPFLRPVLFVRGEVQPTLFMNVEDEDLLQGAVEEIADDDEAHVPTADRVARLFSGAGASQALQEDEDTSDAGQDEEELEEIDFADLGRMQAEVDAAAATRTLQTADVAIHEVEQQFTGFYIDPSPATLEVDRFIVESEMIIEENHLPPTLDSALTPQEEPSNDPMPTFFVDTTPTPSGFAWPPPPIERIYSNTTMPGIPDADDEEIVYVAPHPRKDHQVATPVPTSATLPAVSTFSTTSILTGTTSTMAFTSAVSQVETVETITAPTLVPDIPPAPSLETFAFETLNTATPPRRLMDRRVGHKPKSLLRPRVRRQARTGRRIFCGMGAAALEREESRLREEGDSRKSQRRRGDSDLDWGDEEDGASEVDMDVDEGIDVSAMKGFINSMSQNGSRHVTMDDLEVDEKIRLEDAEEDVAGSDHSSDESDEIGEVVFDMEEKHLIGEAYNGGLDLGIEEESEDDDVSEDNLDTSVEMSFQERLDYLRKHSANHANKGKAKAVEKASNDDVDDYYEDEEIDAILQKFFSENGQPVGGSSRQAKTFRAVYNGDSDGFETVPSPARKKKDKGKYIPSELKEQWDRDRVKKAEKKTERELQRLIAAADPLVTKKGGKKGRKAMRRAAAMGADGGLLHHVVDMNTLEREIRRFIGNLGGGQSMALPPMTKEERKKVHELANAFNLKSVSKGKGGDRYTTLIKTTRSGLNIDERKIGRVLRTTEVYIKGGRGSTVRVPKHREGDVVGKEAPKIGIANIGYRMLEGMGWADGDRIGVTGGPENPLTAVIKTTKLGLGAVRL